MDLLGCPKKLTTICFLSFFFEKIFVLHVCTLSGQSSLPCAKLQLMKNIDLQPCHGSGRPQRSSLVAGDGPAIGPWCGKSTLWIVFCRVRSFLMALPPVRILGDRFSHVLIASGRV